MSHESEHIVDLIVTGGTVVNASHRQEATIVVNKGKVEALLAPGASVPTARRTLDVDGRLLLPGGVDPHCHIGEIVGEHAGQDDYESATIAALHGGTTTVVNFAIPEAENESPLDCAQRRLGEGATARIDHALHGGLVKWEPGLSDQIAGLAELGIRTIKMFTTYRGERMVEPETILEVLRSLHRQGGMGYVHAEADHVIEDALALSAEAGRIDASHLPETRPALAENAAVAQVLATARHLSAPVYFVHQSTPEAVSQVRAARREGLRAYTETCPHYLLLDDSVYEKPGAEGFVCCPPLRSDETRKDLVTAALVGDVDTIGSDHCCFTLEQKSTSRHDVRHMPNGLPGVETRIPAAFTALVVNAGVSLERFVALTSTNAARLNGLNGKGWIGPGADADFYSIDPEACRTTDAAELHMATDYTPYQGLTLFGWPVEVVSGGRVVIDQNGFHDPGPVGRFLATHPLDDALLT
ncbi:amidohydrolase family protein [Paenarthrobacter sp. YJN-5]|uniref:amidohydrolase family protein n=1 Tax=Paenarthrobacter sp. YJN-5 TaxID=2735316 RepID=UPI0018784606|nr:amidohydrolase family protein [Paenarthrobacter sp. YJN-5]QOT19827.1 amidohydrolase family protein [Paenarthrobacter sp. YJN-5]